MAHPSIARLWESALKGAKTGCLCPPYATRMSRMAAPGPKAAEERRSAPSGVKTPVGASRAQSKARSCRETFDRARGALYAPGELGERPSAARRAGRGGNKQRSGGPLSHRAGAPGMAHPGYEGVFARSGGRGFGDFCRNKVCPRRSSHKPVRCRHSGESRNDREAVFRLTTSHTEPYLHH